MKNFSYEKLTERNSPKIKQKLSEAVVGIAGCGGLGSNVAFALARSGVGKLVLVDFDVVDITNLNRQQFFLSDVGMKKVDALSEKLLQINPQIKIEKYQSKLTDNNVQTIFADVQVVVEAFDKVSEKASLLKAFGKSFFKAKFLVTASGVAGFGKSNSIQTKKLAQNIFVCGDNKTDFLSEGVMAPRVMIAAGHQANKVLELLEQLN